jgi:hypothetical protein
MNLRGQYNRQELFSGTQSSLQAGAPRVSVGVNSNLRRLFYYDVNAEGAYLQSRPFAPVDAPAAQTNGPPIDTTTRLRAPLRMPSWFSLTPAPRGDSRSTLTAGTPRPVSWGPSL